MFQFLIVRLKFQLLIVREDIREKVSIPYSTIKIIVGEIEYDMIMVSIPYSTIKISEKNENVSSGSVSIPYSTIKI